MPRCSDFRDRALARLVECAPAPGDDPHVAECPECQAWVRRMGAQLGELASLPAVPAPADLDARLERELERFHVAAREGEARAREGAGALERLAAPGALDGLVAERLAQHGAGEPAAPACEGLLRSLDRLRAPAVLDRLVAEELADPAAQARRFAGDLERVPAPGDLERGVRSELTGRRRSGPHRRRKGVLASIGLAAAAALAVWVALPEPEPTYSIELVEVTDVGEMPELLRALANGMSSGALDGREGSGF